MAKQNQTPDTVVGFLQRTVNTFGEKLWEKTADVAIAMKAMNTDKKPLDAGSDAIRSLKKPGLYYQMSQYGLQLVCVYGDGSWGYAGLAKDKDGDDIIDEEHTYNVQNVQAKRRFVIPGVKDEDGKEVAIPAGFETTKAFAAS